MTTNTKDSLIRKNAEQNPWYAPYCLACPTFDRMRKVAPFWWQCRHCGAEHDARTEEEKAKL